MYSYDLVTGEITHIVNPNYKFNPDRKVTIYPTSEPPFSDSVINSAVNSVVSEHISKKEISQSETVVNVNSTNEMAEFQTTKLTIFYCECIIFNI